MIDGPSSPLDLSSLFHDPLAEKASKQSPTAVPASASSSNNRRRRSFGAREGRMESRLAVELDLQRLREQTNRKMSGRL